MDGLKINLHITERCNYNCKYCFAHFDGKRDLPIKTWQKIIDDIKSAGNVSAINFAGGEPVLYNNFPALVDYAKNCGFSVSLISNGSLLLNEKLAPLDMLKKIDTLGISADSFNEKILINLGCCDSAFRVLSKEKLLNVIDRVKSINPTIKIKLNTVVSKLNKNERLTEIENKIKIDRWKFLKAKFFENKNFSNKNLIISDAEFENFVARNQRRKGEVVLESIIRRSYIIIDNVGNLLDNFGDSYEIVGNILEENFSEVFSSYKFDRKLYQERYSLVA